MAATASDCADLQDPGERLACADPALAQRQQSRAACLYDPEPHGCLAEQLARRIVQLQISLQRVPVFAAVTYRCPQAPLHAAYYRSEPAAVRLSYQAYAVVAFTAPAGSGARFSAPGVEIWEHQGVARFTWHDVPLSCPRE